MEVRDEWVAPQAHALWEEAGRSDGYDGEHWDQASIEYDELQTAAAA
ncbi:DUF2934 domain-containing protein [Rhizobium sp. 2YAF20]